MSTHFADLSIHFDVNRATKYIIELVPREDDSVADFEADTGGTWYNSLEALKTRLTASSTISSYADMATMLGLTDSEEGQTDSEEDLNDSEEESDDEVFVPEWTHTPQPAAAYQYGRDTGYTGLFGRPGTTVVTQRRPDEGQYSVAPFQIKYDDELRRRRYTAFDMPVGALRLVMTLTTLTTRIRTHKMTLAIPTTRLPMLRARMTTSRWMMHATRSATTR